MLPRRVLVALSILASCAIPGGVTRPALAQSNPWDPVISNTDWYVPTDQLLAYAAPNTNFADPFAVGDQTLWALGTSTNGHFTGSTVVDLAVGAFTATSTASTQGYVSPSGQITMLFRTTGSLDVTLGLGQMQTVDGGPAMEMQMITGDSLLVTHWAYMLPYDPATYTPPAPAPVHANSVPQWAWSAGSRWTIVSPATFGTSSPGKFVIADYDNGYFWGSGVGPDGSAASAFTLLGSITPEGKVLLNTLDASSTLTSLYGNITGDEATAQMLLAAYNSLGLPSGNVTYIYVVAPYGDAVATSNPAAAGAADVLYGVASSSSGLDGPLAPTIDALDTLSGPALSNAIDQTLPILAGDAGPATYATQQQLRQAVMTRLDGLSGTGRGESPATLRAVGFNPLVAGFHDNGLGDTAGAVFDWSAPDRAGGRSAGASVWFSPLGTTARQGSLDGMAGYRADSGGLATGIDWSLGRDLTLGGVVAYTRSTISSGDDATPARLDVDGVQAGLYGAYAITSGVELGADLDAGLLRNSESRTISFMGSTASADYASRSAHAGVRLRTLVPVSTEVTLVPSLGVDYGQLDTEGYSESGAGALNLSVDPQSYRELLVSTGLRGVYRITSNLSLRADAGLSRDMLRDELRTTAAYAGGGGSFVTTGTRRFALALVGRTGPGGDRRQRPAARPELRRGGKPDRLPEPERHPVHPVSHLSGIIGGMVEKVLPIRQFRDAPCVLSSSGAATTAATSPWRTT